MLILVLHILNAGANGAATLKCITALSLAIEAVAAAGFI